MIKKKGIRARVQAKARINPLVSRTLSENPDWAEWSPDDLTYIANNNSTPLDTDKLDMSEDAGFEAQFAVRNAVTGLLGGIANAIVGVVNAVTPDADPSEIPGGDEAMREEGAIFRGTMTQGVASEYEEVQGGTDTVMSDRDFNPITQAANLVVGAVRTLADPFTAEPPEGAPNFYADVRSGVSRAVNSSAFPALPTEDDGEIDGAAEPDAPFGANFQREFAAQAEAAATADAQVPVERKETSAQRIERILSERPIGTDAQIRESAKEAVSFGLGTNQSLPQYVEEIIVKKNAGTMNAGERILLEDLERDRINRAINKLRREDEEMKAAQAAASTPSSNPLTMLANAVVRTVDAAASVVTPPTSVSSSTPSSKWSSATRRSARVAEAKALQDAYYAGRPEARAQDASRKAKQTQSVDRYRNNVAKLDFRGTRNNL